MARAGTGTFLGELYEPYVTLQARGYEVVFATVGGARPAIAPESRNEMTSVSGLEELYIETFVMGIAAQLEQRGYAQDAAFPGSAHALRDCNLITSQTPFSTREFSRLYALALGDYRRGARCAPAVRHWAVRERRQRNRPSVAAEVSRSGSRERRRTRRA